MRELSDKDVATIKKCFEAYSKTDPDYPLQKNFKIIDRIAQMARLQEFCNKFNLVVNQFPYYGKGFADLFESSTDYDRTIDLFTNEEWINKEGIWIATKALFVTVIKTLDKKKRFKADVKLSGKIIQLVAGGCFGIDIKEDTIKKSFAFTIGHPFNAL